MVKRMPVKETTQNSPRVIKWTDFFCKKLPIEDIISHPEYLIKFLIEFLDFLLFWDQTQTLKNRTDVFDFGFELLCIGG